MKLYRQDSLIHFEDGDLKFSVSQHNTDVSESPTGSNLADITLSRINGIVKRTKQASEILDINGDSYGTTVNDVISSIFDWQEVNILDEDGASINVQNPLPTDGDSVYCKDINQNFSTIGDFSGEICDLFNDYQLENIAPSVGSGGVNPKSFTVSFNRPVIGSVFGLGSSNTSISNAKITIFGIAGEPLKVIDFSDDDTKRSSLVFRFEQQIFAGGFVEFYTDDEVAISGAGVTKSQTTSIEAINGLISVDNSTDEPLLADGVFTGDSVDTLNYGMVIICTKSDQASATDGLSIQFSTDNVNWDHTDEFSIAAGVGKTFTIQTIARYMRIVYTNGSVPQTYFRLQTLLKPVYVKPSSHRIADSLSGQDDAELSKAILSGEDQDNIFQNVRSTEVGNLRVADFLVEVGRGNIPGYSFVRKFGYNPAVTTDTADIYEYGGVSGVDDYTFSADGVADIDRLSSDNSLDIGIEITIEGLDINGDAVIQVVTLDGTDAETPVALTTSLWRVNRVYNSDTTELAGNVYVFVNGAVVSGVPSAPSSVRGYVSIENGQTLQGIYTIPNGKKGYFYSIKTSIIKKQAAFATFTMKIKEYGKVNRTQDIFGLTTTGTSQGDSDSDLPQEFPGKTDFIPSADPDSTIGFSVSYLMLLIDD